MLNINIVKYHPASKAKMAHQAHGLWAQKRKQRVRGPGAWVADTERALARRCLPHFAYTFKLSLGLVGTKQGDQRGEAMGIFAGWSLFLLPKLQMSRLLS